MVAGDVPLFNTNPPLRPREENVDERLPRESRVHTPTNRFTRFFFEIFRPEGIASSARSKLIIIPSNPKSTGLDEGSPSRITGLPPVRSLRAPPEIQMRPAGARGRVVFTGR